MRVRFLHHAIVHHRTALCGQSAQSLECGIARSIPQRATAHQVTAMRSVLECFDALRHEQSTRKGKRWIAHLNPTSRNIAPCDRYVVTALYVYVLWHEPSALSGIGGIACSIPTPHNSAPRDCYTVGARVTAWRSVHFMLSCFGTNSPH